MRLIWEKESLLTFGEQHLAQGLSRQNLPSGASSSHLEQRFRAKLLSIPEGVQVATSSFQNKAHPGGGGEESQPSLPVPCPPPGFHLPRSSNINPPPRLPKEPHNRFIEGSYMFQQGRPWEEAVTFSGGSLCADCIQHKRVFHNPQGRPVQGRVRSAPLTRLICPRPTPSPDGSIRRAAVTEGALLP